jgi:hypothetical protein
MADSYFIEFNASGEWYSDGGLYGSEAAARAQFVNTCEHCVPGIRAVRIRRAFLYQNPGEVVVERSLSELRGELSLTTEHHSDGGIVNDQECCEIPHVMWDGRLIRDYSHLPVERQLALVTGFLADLLVELETLVKEIEVAPSVSRNTHMDRSELPVLVERSRKLLAAIQAKSPAFVCHPGVALCGLADCALVYVGTALALARPIAAKGLIKRGENIRDLRAAVWCVRTGFENMCDVLCGMGACDEPA